MTTESNIQHNPLLTNIKLPGETFTLPSMGLFYNDGEIDASVQNGEIHIHPMVALDEILIKTPDLLFSGKAVSEVFSHCIPTILKPEKLLTKDVDYLLMCLRKVTFGDSMTVEYDHMCNDTEDDSTHSYDISISTSINNAKRMDPTSLTKFIVKLPNGQTVKLKPLTFEKFIVIMQGDDEAERTPQEIRDDMINSFVGVIAAVDDITDAKMIREWIGSISVGWLKLITSQIEESADWGSEFTHTTICKECGEEISITIPMNPIAFFT